MLLIDTGPFIRRRIIAQQLILIIERYNRYKTLELLARFRVWPMNAAVDQCMHRVDAAIDQFMHRVDAAIDQCMHRVAEWCYYIRLHLSQNNNQVKFGKAKIEDIC